VITGVQQESEVVICGVPDFERMKMEKCWQSLYDMVWLLHGEYDAYSRWKKWTGHYRKV